MTAKRQVRERAAEQDRKGSVVCMVSQVRTCCAVLYCAIREQSLQIARFRKKIVVGVAVYSVRRHVKVWTKN